jgi:hypothetical protein
MKRNLLILFCFCFLVYPLSNAGSEGEKGDEFNGYEWNRISKLEKIGFIQGWYEAGVSALVSIVALEVKEQLKGIMDYPKTSRENNFSEHAKIIREALEAKGLELDGLTFGQIILTIDKIYSDPRVMKWSIKQIMPIVRGRFKKGWTEKQVDEVMAYYIRRHDLLEKYKNLSHKSEGERKKLSEEFKSLNSSMPEILKTLEDY